MTASTCARICAVVLAETSMSYYDEAKGYLIEARLLPLASALGFGADIDRYVAHVLDQAVPLERRKLIDALTINETSWYRDQAPYQALVEQMLPALISARSATRTLRIWSAACSSGQEAYSVAMLLDQHLPGGWTAEIVATDISESMVNRVKNGRYGSVEVNRGLPASALVTYFQRAGNEWEVIPRLRSMVRASRLNLTDSFGHLGQFDIILLRNVLIYFDAATKYDVLRNIHPHLAQDGYLLLGSTETTLDMPSHVAPLWRTESLGRVQAHRRAATSTTSVTRIGA